jgi:hypothetical protein
MIRVAALPNGSLPVLGNIKHDMQRDQYELDSGESKKYFERLQCVVKLFIRDRLVRSRCARGIGNAECDGGGRTWPWTWSRKQCTRCNRLRCIETTLRPDHVVESLIGCKYHYARVCVTTSGVESEENKIHPECFGYFELSFEKEKNPSTADSSAGSSCARFWKSGAVLTRQFGFNLNLNLKLKAVIQVSTQFSSVRSVFSNNFEGVEPCRSGVPPSSKS